MSVRISVKKVINCQWANVKHLSSIANEPPHPGIKSTRYTDVPKFTNLDSYDAIPIYRILYPSGCKESLGNLKLNHEILEKMYRNMMTLNIMDKILYESQRQGRISFYMSNYGEEAVQVGSAAALTLKDIIYAQYREAGVLLWRGFRMQEFMNQCYGNCDDEGKGRQMPVHYGSKDLNFVTISSPLTTQLPQAAGAAYALKRAKHQACVIVYFGEGAASEGDAHAAFNFAATLKCPVIFLCRNNAYAISTSTRDQYAGDGIAARGPAYGIETIRVDGNDILAVYSATQLARNFCLTKGKPVLIEALTYRIGHHSTSDDSTTYRSVEETNNWSKHVPILRFRAFLEQLGIWNQEKETALVNSTKKEILSAFAEAEKKPKPLWTELFTDVYHDMPNHIRKQMESMKNHLKEYSDHYPLNAFKQA